MPEVKDLQHEEEKKKLEKIEQDRGTDKPWYYNVSPPYWFGALAILFIQYQTISKAGGKVGELWPTLIAVLVALYFIGKTVKTSISPLLSPEEADEALKKRMKVMQRDERLSTNAYIRRAHNLFHSDGMPQHYMYSVRDKEDDGLPIDLVGLVWATGQARGYAVIFESVGEYMGSKTLPVKSAIPNDLQRMKDAGFDIDRWGMLGFRK